MIGHKPPSGPKQRAKSACSNCRRRKVRCDLGRVAGICTNCFLDEVPCTVKPSLRHIKQEKSSLEAVSCVGSLEDEQQQAVDDVPERVLLGLQLGLTHGHSGCHNILLKEQLIGLDGVSLEALAGEHSAGQLKVTLPVFIAPVPPWLKGEDVEYASQKGAFELPTNGLRNELLRYFVQYVHPYLPILDLSDFLTRINGNHGSATVSLLVLQAVLFSAIPFIEDDVLEALGLGDRKAARKTFYNKVKALWDIGFESDRLATLQAITLLTYYHDEPEELKDVRYWLSVAVSLVYDTDTSLIGTLETRRSEGKVLWKRIWWCCYMREKLVALAMRRSLRLNDCDFNIGPLQLTDFDQEPLPASLTPMLGQCPAAFDASIRKQLAHMCIEYAQLCACVSGILHIVYSAPSLRSMKLEGRKVDAWNTLLLRDKALTDKFQTLRSTNPYLQAECHDVGSICDNDIVRVHKAVLAGLYFTAVLTLHLPQVVDLHTLHPISPNMKVCCYNKVRAASMRVASMYGDLRGRDLIRFLPSSGITFLWQGILSHLALLRYQPNWAHDAIARRILVLREALHQLHNIYGSAGRVIAHIERLSRVFRIPVLGTRTCYGTARSSPCQPVATKPRRDVVDETFVPRICQPGTAHLAQPAPTSPSEDLPVRDTQPEVMDHIFPKQSNDNSGDNRNDE